MQNEIIEDLEEGKNIEEVEDIEDNEEEKKCIQLKSKKPRSEKQIAAFKRTLEMRQIKIKERLDIKTKEKEEEKKEVEEKLIQKAISIKKKRVKKELLLSQISDDDEPIDKIKKKIVKSKLITLEKNIPFFNFL